MNTWIFQGNPRKFDVDSYLRSRSDILWTVGNSKMQNNISVSDVAYIWRADGNVRGSGGIVAKGYVTDLPKPMADDGSNLWYTNDGNDIFNRVAIRIDDVRLSPENGMLLRTELEKHPVLCNLWILKWRAAILYQVTPEHAKVIGQLWAAEGKLARKSSRAAGSKQ